MRRDDRFLLPVLIVLLLAVLALAMLWEQHTLKPAVTPAPAPISTPAPAAMPAAAITTPAPTQEVSIFPAATAGPLPGATPAPELTAAPTPTPARTPAPGSSLRGKLRITEIMVKNRATLRDEDGDFPDWFELENCGDETISLAGCRVADREGRYGWVFPEKSLAPGERAVIFASRKDRAETLHADFALSGEDLICLYNSDGLPVDSARCADCEADVSLALAEDGSWQQSLYPTPGFENSAAGYTLFQQTLAAPGPLVISEAAVKNLGLNVAGTADDCDWVEIRNISDQPVRLSDYYLSDKDELPFLWRLPDEELQPGGFALFVCEEEGSGFFGSTPCTGFSLNAERDRLYLTRFDGTLTDYAALRGIPAGGSFGRMADEAGFFYFAEPTPGYENRAGARRVSAMPVNLTPDGVFEGVEKVTLTLDGAGELHYTINGPAPTRESPLYTGPIELTETCFVSVKSFEPDALPSRTLTLTFLLNEGHTLPVVSFVAENVQDFSNIYDAGAKIYEMPGTLAFFRDGESFHIGCAARLNGETSLILPKKNLLMKFSGAYEEPTLEYDLFGGGVTSFDALLVRAGQDQYQAVLRNELAQSLAEKAETAVINQRSLFCVLYLNGQYTGLYTVKERPSASLYAGIAGVEKDSVECFEAPAPYLGTFYNQTVGFVNTHDMTLDENYDAFCEAVDIDSLIDWLILEGFCANTDVTSGNLRYARSPQADGKWHLLFYDLDAAFRSFESIQSNLLNDYGASHIQAASFSVPLMKNERFRDRFLTRAAALLRGPLSNEAVLEELSRMADELRGEIPRDYERIGSNAASWEHAIEELRAMIEERDWRQANIDGLCRAFELDREARGKYFGDMDRVTGGEDAANEQG